MKTIVFDLTAENAMLGFIGAMLTAPIQAGVLADTFRLTAGKISFLELIGISIIFTLTFALSGIALTLLASLRLKNVRTY